MCCPGDGTSGRWLSWFEAAEKRRRNHILTMTNRVLLSPKTNRNGFKNSLLDR